MDEHRQHIVPVPDEREVVLEPGGIHFSPTACQHPDDVIFQPVIVHVDVAGHSIVCSRAGPIALTPVTVKRLHHRVRVKHRGFCSYLITIIPFHKVVKTEMVLLCQLSHLALGKPEIACHIARHHHRVLREIIECRLRLIFFHWQDACHINTGKNLRSLTSLKHTP